MNCASEATLRAFLDEELDNADQKEVKGHVLSCRPCGERAAQMAQNIEQIRDWLAPLSLSDKGEVDPTAAYKNLQNTIAHRRASWFRWPTWLSVPRLSLAASIAALLLIVSVSPAHSWAQRILQMLRVQKLAVVPIDSSALMQAGLPKGRSQALSQLISDDLVVTLKPAEPVIVPDVTTATAQVGFRPETLDGLGKPQKILIEDQGAFHMTLDVDRIRAVLDEAGRSDIKVPDSVSGSVVAVQVSKGVNLQYGPCTASDETCIHFMQIPSPKVSVPPGFNVKAVAEAGLQLAGLSTTEATQFAEGVDWTSTLVIPVPRNKASYRSFPVDGVTGTLIEWPPTRTYRGRYDLIWLKNGVIHAVSGDGSSSTGLAAVANLGS